jgi:hypothetical protein
MISNQLGFLLKLLIFSALLSLFIKYVSPVFPVTETTTNALIMVLLPTIIMTLVLFWRFRSQEL